MAKGRIIFAIVVSFFLIACNVGYLMSFANQRQPEFAQQIDNPAIQYLSLALLAGIIFFAVKKPTQEESES